MNQLSHDLSFDYKKIIVISKYTLKEYLQGKVIQHLFFVGLIVAFFCFVGGELSYGAKLKVSLDISLGLFSIAANGLAIFLGIGTIRDEINSNRIQMILSRSISRGTYLLGRFFGALLFLLFCNISLSFLSLIYYLILGGVLSKLLFFSLYFSILEASILLLIAIIFSMIASKSVAIVYTLVVFICGHALNGTKDILYAKNTLIIEKIILVSSYLFPDFSKLNIKKYLLYDVVIDNENLFFATSYGIFYILFLLVISFLLFKKKDLV